MEGNKLSYFKQVKILVAFAVIFSICVRFVWSTTQTINTLPSANATFIADIQTFLGNEIADYMNIRFSNEVAVGGLGPTDASLTHTITAITAFPKGFYVQQDATSHTYTASKRTFVYVRDDDSRTITIGGAAITYDDHLVFAEAASGTEIPDVPTGTLLLFYVDTDGTSITTVTDLRGGSVDASYFADLETAIDNVGSKQTIVISDVQNVGTKTATQDILVVSGGLIRPENGTTFTISGGFDSPSEYQCFDVSGGGTIAFGATTVEDYPEWFGLIDGTNDETQINAAITALNKGDTVLNGQAYTVDASITGKTNVNLRGREGITTITIGTADINAFYADTKTNITISGIKWVGTGANADTERLVYFTSCTDVHSRNNIYTNSIIGLQFETCTRGTSIKDTFLDILRKTDFSEGYGVLANLNNDDIKVLHSSFNGVERHCVYFSSGSDNCIAADSTVIDSKGAPFVAGSTDAQGVMQNIKFVDLIIDGIQTAGGGSDDVDGISINNFVHGVQITGNQIYDNDVGGGIRVQTGSTSTNFAEDINISNNLIDTIDGSHAILIQNAKKVQILGNQIDNIDVAAATYSGISVTVNGTDTGSAIDEVIIADNIVDTGKYSLSVAGADATHRVTNLILGDNQFANATTSTFNMGAIANITYKTTWDTYRPTFYLDNAAANQTDVSVNPTHTGAYAGWVSPFNGFLYATWARVNGAISAESIEFEIKKNGSDFTNGVTISAGSLTAKEEYAIGFSVAEGDLIQMTYTTPAGFLPDGTRDFVAGFEIIRDVSQ